MSASVPDSTDWGCAAIRQLSGVHRSRRQRRRNGSPWPLRFYRKL